MQIYLLISIATTAFAWFDQLYKDIDETLVRIVSGPTAAVVDGVILPVLEPGIVDQYVNEAFGVGILLGSPVFALIYWQCRRGFSLILSNLAAFLWLMGGAFVIGYYFYSA